MWCDCLLAWLGFFREKCSNVYADHFGCYVVVENTLQSYE